MTNGRQLDKIKTKISKKKFKKRRIKSLRMGKAWALSFLSTIDFEFMIFDINFLKNLKISKNAKTFFFF